jgi:hypothetical protein
VRYAPVFDFLEVPPQPAEDFLPLGIAELLPEFMQSEVDDIVMMQFLGSDVVAEFEPNAMQEVDFPRCQAWCMWAQIKNVFLPAWEIDFQGQLRFRIR